MKNVLGKGSNNNNFLTQPSFYIYAIITLTEKSIIIKSDEEKKWGGVFRNLLQTNPQKVDEAGYG